MVQVQEGFIPFHGYQTYYRIVGPKSKKAPLLMLHGGPGSTHNYFEIFDDFAKRTGRQLVMYDQIGCGQSSIPDAPSVYNAHTWVEELKALRDYLHLDRVHLLGQSWGGMLEIIYLCDEMPAGIKSATFASTLSSAKLWSQENHRLIKQLPQDEQAAIAQAEQNNDFSGDAYLKANDHFMALHSHAPYSEDDPECLTRSKRSGTLAYNTAWGPNEYTPLGNLGSYEYTDKLHHMYVPTLITSGTNDLCTPLVAKTMYDALPNAKWELFAGARHMSFVEQPEHYQNILASWLAAND